MEDVLLIEDDDAKSDVSIVTNSTHNTLDDRSPILFPSLHRFNAGQRDEDCFRSNQGPCSPVIPVITASFLRKSLKSSSQNNNEDNDSQDSSCSHSLLSPHTQKSSEKRTSLYKTYISPETCKHHIFSPPRISPAKVGHSPDTQIKSPVTSPHIVTNSPDTWRKLQRTCHTSKDNSPIETFKHKLGSPGSISARIDHLQDMHRKTPRISPAEVQNSQEFYTHHSLGPLMSPVVSHSPNTFRPSPRTKVRSKRNSLAIVQSPVQSFGVVVRKSPAAILSPGQSFDSCRTLNSQQSTNQGEIIGQYKEDKENMSRKSSPERKHLNLPSSNLNGMSKKNDHGKNLVADDMEMIEDPLEKIYDQDYWNEISSSNNLNEISSSNNLNEMSSSNNLNEISSSNNLNEMSSSNNMNNLQRKDSNLHVIHPETELVFPSESKKRKLMNHAMNTGISQMSGRHDESTMCAESQETYMEEAGICGSKPSDSLKLGNSSMPNDEDKQENIIPYEKVAHTNSLLNKEKLMILEGLPLTQGSVLQNRKSPCTESHLKRKRELEETMVIMDIDCAEERWIQKDNSTNNQIGPKDTRGITLNNSDKYIDNEQEHPNRRLMATSVPLSIEVPFRESGERNNFITNIQISKENEYVDSSQETVMPSKSYNNQIKPGQVDQQGDNNDESSTQQGLDGSQLLFPDTQSTMSSSGRLQRTLEGKPSELTISLSSTAKGAGSLQEVEPSMAVSDGGRVPGVQTGQLEESSTAPHCEEMDNCSDIEPSQMILLDTQQNRTQHSEIPARQMLQSSQTSSLSSISDISESDINYKSKEKDIIIKIGKMQTKIQRKLTSIPKRTLAIDISSVKQQIQTIKSILIRIAERHKAERNKLSMDIKKGNKTKNYKNLVRQSLMELGERQKDLFKLFQKHKDISNVMKNDIKLNECLALTKSTDGKDQMEIGNKESLVKKGGSCKNNSKTVQINNQAKTKSKSVKDVQSKGDNPKNSVLIAHEDENNDVTLVESSEVRGQDQPEDEITPISPLMGSIKTCLLEKRKGKPAVIPKHISATATHGKVGPNSHNFAFANGTREIFSDNVLANHDENVGKEKMDVDEDKQTSAKKLNKSDKNPPVLQDRTPFLTNSCSQPVKVQFDSNDALKKMGLFTSSISERNVTSQNSAEHTTTRTEQGQGDAGSPIIINDDNFRLNLPKSHGDASNNKGKGKDNVGNSPAELQDMDQRTSQKEIVKQTDKPYTQTVKNQTLVSEKPLQFVHVIPSSAPIVLSQSTSQDLTTSLTQKAKPSYLSVPIATPSQSVKVTNIGLGQSQNVKVMSNNVQGQSIMPAKIIIVTPPENKQPIQTTSTGLVNSGSQKQNNGKSTQAQKQCQPSTVRQGGVINMNIGGQGQNSQSSKTKENSKCNVKPNKEKSCLTQKVTQQNLQSTTYPIPKSFDSQKVQKTSSFENRRQHSSQNISEQRMPIATKPAKKAQKKSGGWSDSQDDMMKRVMEDAMRIINDRPNNRPDIPFSQYTAEPLKSINPDIFKSPPIRQLDGRFNDTRKDLSPSAASFTTFRSAFPEYSPDIGHNGENLPEEVLVSAGSEFYDGMKYPPLSLMIEKQVLQPGSKVLSTQARNREFRASLTEDGCIESLGGELFQTPVKWLAAILGKSVSEVKKVKAYREVCYKGRPLMEYVEDPTIQPMEQNVVDLTQDEHDRLDHTPDSQSSQDSMKRLKNLLNSCTIRLLGERDLITNDDLPENFWCDDFSSVRLGPDMWENVDKWD